jgi:hypothetical protein
MVGPFPSASGEIPLAGNIFISEIDGDTFSLGYKIAEKVPERK